MDGSWWFTGGIDRSRTGSRVRRPRRFVPLAPACARLARRMRNSLSDVDNDSYAAPTAKAIGPALGCNALYSEIMRGKLFSRTMQTKNHLVPLSLTRSKHGVSLDERSCIAKFVLLHISTSTVRLDAVSADGNRV